MGKRNTFRMPLLWSHAPLERWGVEVLFLFSAMAFLVAFALSSTAFDPTHLARYAAASLMVFASLSGLWVFSIGVKEYRLRRRRKILRRSYPNHPWRADFLDCESKWVDVSYMRLANALMIALLIFLSCIPLWYRTEFLKRYDDAKYVIMLYVLISIPLLLYILYYIAHAKKFGRVSLGFERFPFFLGEILDVRLRTSRPFGIFTRMQVTLRCVDQTVDSNEQGWMLREEYVDTLMLEPAADYDSRRPLEMAILLPLPSMKLPTRLTTDRPRYWVLDVSTDTPGLNFDVSFMVPVYTRT